MARHRPVPSYIAPLAVVLLLVGACQKSFRAPAPDAAAPAPRPTAATDTTAPAPSPAPDAEPANRYGEPPPPGGSDGYPLLKTGQVTDVAELRAQVEALTKAGSAKSVLDALQADRERALPAMRLALRHEETNVRVQAAMILVRLGRPSRETTDAFVAALLKDPNQEVRATVGRALTDYTDAALIEPLLTSLAKDPYGTARANAAWALGSQGSKAAVDGLVAALDDEETWVRLRSLTALKRLKATKALAAVVERLRDPNTLVRERALETLQKLTGKRIGPDYDKWKKAVR